MGKLGDMPTRVTDPLETYYDQLRQGVMLPRRKWVKKPDFQPPVIPGAEPLQKFLDEHALPELWTFFADYKKLLECGTYHVKRPNWVEPPLTAIAQPIRTDDVGVSIPGITNVTVLTYEVPDRCFGTLKGIGQGLCPYEGWDNILWTLTVNEKPIKGYFEFRNQIGHIDRENNFPSPVSVKYKDVIKLLARQKVALAATTAYASMTMYTWGAKDISQDGTYQQQHVAT